MKLTGRISLIKNVKLITLELFLSFPTINVVLSQRT